MLNRLLSAIITIVILLTVLTACTDTDDDKVTISNDYVRHIDSYIFGARDIHDSVLSTSDLEDVRDSRRETSKIEGRWFRKVNSEASEASTPALNVAMTEAIRVCEMSYNNTEKFFVSMLEIIDIYGEDSILVNNTFFSNYRIALDACQDRIHEVRNILEELDKEDGA